MSEKSLSKLEEQQAKGEEQLAVMEGELEEISSAISKLEGADPEFAHASTSVARKLGLRRGCLASAVVAFDSRVDSGGGGGR